MREITEANKWNYFRSGARAGLMLRLRQVHFPFPYLCLNGMILPTASLNCFVLSQLLPCSIQNLPSSFVYITEMNIDRTKVITVLVLCNTPLYFLLLEKWHQQLDVSTSCKVCNMMRIYSLEKSFKSPWTWLSTCIFQNILEYSITLLCTYTCTFCPHSHTKTRQRLDNNFQSLKIYHCWFFPNYLREIMGFLVDDIHANIFLSQIM